MENYEKNYKESLERARQELKDWGDLDKQVDEFEYFYNNFMRLFHDGTISQMPQLTDCQKEFVRCLCNKFINK